MPTLHVRNVPEDLYEALRRRAEERGTTITAEAIAALQRAMRVDLAGVRELLAEYTPHRPTARPPSGSARPSAAELVREDRDKR